MLHQSPFWIGGLGEEEKEDPFYLRFRKAFRRKIPGDLGEGILCKASAFFFYSSCQQEGGEKTLLLSLIMRPWTAAVNRGKRFKQPLSVELSPSLVLSRSLSNSVRRLSLASSRGHVVALIIAIPPLHLRGCLLHE